MTHRRGICTVRLTEQAIAILLCTQYTTASEAPIVTPQCPQDWDPRSDDVIRDPLAAYDGLRARCPMAWSGLLGWTLTDNAGIRAVLHDPETFSNSVSRHLSLPNGMDPPQHTLFRRLVERYFEPAEVAGLEPELDGIARELAEAARGAGNVDLVSAFCEPFAVRAQCAFLGWPRSVEAQLAEWARHNEAATREQDRQALAEIAAELDALVVALLDERRALGDDAPPDRTTRLLHEQVDGRPLTDAELVSILRNWTMGGSAPWRPPSASSAPSSPDTRRSRNGCAQTRPQSPTPSRRSCACTGRCSPIAAASPGTRPSPASRSPPGIA